MSLLTLECVWHLHICYLHLLVVPVEPDVKHAHEQLQE